MRARGTSISLKVLYMSLLLHIEARVWAEVEDKADELRLQGPRGVYTPSHHRLSHLITRLYMVYLCYLASGLRYCLIMVHRILFFCYIWCGCFGLRGGDLR